MPACLGTRWRRSWFDIGPRARCSVVGSENIRCVGTEVAVQKLQKCVYGEIEERSEI